MECYVFEKGGEFRKEAGHESLIGARVALGPLSIIPSEISLVRVNFHALQWICTGRQHSPGWLPMSLRGAAQT